MLIENQHPHNKSIVVSVLGVPNAGKSSLINYLLGFDLSVVTHRPQTTRNKFHCTFTVDRTEIVLVDTPGLHRSNQDFNKRLNCQAKEGAEGADLNLLLIDLSADIAEQVIEFKMGMSDFTLNEVWVVFTKTDLVQNQESLCLEEKFNVIKEAIPAATKFFSLSSKTGDNVHLLTGALCDQAQPGPHLYPDGDVSNKNERFFAAEYIREQAFRLLNEELPYEIAVLIEAYKDSVLDDGGRQSHISACILVNRPSQRAIVVGSKGQMIKQIGMNAREKIEAMTGGRVHLNLHVKVSPKWFKNNFVLEEIGLPRAPDSHRVWRKK